MPCSALHSGDEHFRIRHYVRPEAASWLGEPLHERTVFIFPFDRDDVSAEVAHEEISSGLRELNPIALLFLDRIHSVTVRSAAGTVQLDRARDDTDHRNVELIRTNNGRIILHQYWWVFRRPIDHMGHFGQRVEMRRDRHRSH